MVIFIMDGRFLLRRGSLFGNNLAPVFFCQPSIPLIRGLRFGEVGNPAFVPGFLFIGSGAFSSQSTSSDDQR
ncbi:hypothetical protein TK06_10160 [Pseudomonas fluorescens]|uniref:Uncharacterized protein n=1 Tax=Pseudomonas fluorescens TaxID=294 RepID=A0A159ZUV1_PSEFL|nr:hypothetical protein TK06_10160 [Pseudomonas fluorescens]